LALGMADVIFEAARDGLPKGMDDSQGLVAVFDRREDDAEAIMS